MGAFKNEKNGTWYVQFRYTDWRGLRQQKLKRGFATKREAQEWERAFLTEKKADVTMPFKTFTELYEKDVRPKLKENTWLTKEHIIKTKILPYFEHKRLCDISAKDVIAWQNEIRKQTNSSGEPFSQGYLKTIHNQLSSLFNHAIKIYGLRLNPASTVGNMGKEERKEMNYWTVEEYSKFSDEMMDKPLSYYAFQMLYWTGIRVGELLALTAGDFDFKNNMLTINKSYQRLHGEDVITPPKTEKSKRTIKMPQFLCDEMQEYLKMFYSPNDGDRIFPISKSYLHHEMDRGSKAAGVKRIRIHDLRHPYVKHTTKIFSLRLMDFQAQAYPDVRRKIRGACQLHRGGQSRIPVRPFCNRKQFPCLPPQAKMSWILYAISMRLSGYTSTRSINSSASSVVSASASKIALDASFRLSCRACSSCFCFACANTAA